ncbi:MAG: hypothetical protein PQ975_02825 [Methanobacterium sp.]
MTSENIQAEKMVEGLIAYIMEFEPDRPPAPIGIIPYSFNTFFKLLSKQKQRNYFVKNVPDLYQETRKEMESYFENATKFDAKDILKIFFLLILWISALGGLFIFMFGLILDFNFFQGILSIIIVGTPSTYLFLVWMITRRRNYFGKKYDENIKRAVQHLIDYGRDKIIEENLNPKDFPIKLRHKDYTGLVYEKKGKNNYVGFFRNEE